ncbi:Forkhead transcription factor [Elasticomyces elasticus]|nr:Forkhead transcription factor [Elasticomyces elasticus]
MSSFAASSTRRAPALEIYQDAGSYGHDDVETALLNALGPLSDASINRNIILNPSTTAPSASSPRKSVVHSSSPPAALAEKKLNSISIPPPPQPAFTTDSPSKKNLSALHENAPAGLNNSRALFATFPTTQPQPSDMDNMYNLQPLGEPNSDFTESTYGYKGPMKRTLTEVAPLKDRPSSAKKPKIEEEDDSFPLPDPKSMPRVEDDGSKPPYSYAVLIGMAILRAPNRRLTLAQIYKWISDTFAHYRIAETGWQNSIRHNLSLNKAFIKIERPKEHAGKGNYWAIEPGMERQFLKDRPGRRITNPEGGAFLHTMPYDGMYGRPSTAPTIGQFALAPSTIKKAEPKAVDSSRFPDDTELSSDATIPASDPALQEDDQDAINMPPPSSRIPHSSPPLQEITSSPPPMAAPAQRHGTPPHMPRFISTSRSGGRKRKFAALNDSGYYSSIESSATRNPATHGQLLTSEADLDRPRIKRGRAEAEIARIRSSSYDSPSKENQQKMRRNSRSGSSPPRPMTSTGLDPLTPAVVFKRPAKPPPSVSPNTNLRMHRHKIRTLLGSPDKAFSPLPMLHEHEPTWSPAFNIAEDDMHPNSVSPSKNSNVNTLTPFTKALFSSAFDIFTDSVPDGPAARGSPEKKSFKRPGTQRAPANAGVLADITGSVKGNRAPGLMESPFRIMGMSPLKMAPAPVLKSPMRLGSPLKRGTSRPEWLDIDLGTFRTGTTGTNDENVKTGYGGAAATGDDGGDLFGVELPSESSEEGVDIMQEFGKIGGTMGMGMGMGVGMGMGAPKVEVGSGSPIKRTAGMGRPALPRSMTSRF